MYNFRRPSESNHTILFPFSPFLHLAFDVRNPPPADNSLAAEKVRSFPQTPGVYLMKDAAGRVIYIGKAKNLRARAGSYFLKAAAEDPRTAKLVPEIRDIDYLDAESEIDALLMEARLIKDILPKFNRDLRDDKTFPYLEIFTHEDFPRVRFTREPKSRGTKLYGPFANPRGLRGAIQVLQKVFKFRTCTLDIDENDPRWRWFRPCLLHSIDAVHGAVQSADLEGAIPQGHPPLAAVSGRGQEQAAWPRCARRWPRRPASCVSRRPPGCATKSRCSKRSTTAAGWKRTSSRRCFPIDPKRGLAGLQKVLHLEQRPRTIEGHRHRPHWRAPTPWPRWCSSSTGCRSSRATGGCGFSGVAGPDDTASIHEAVARRFQHIAAEGETPPDILLIDGGRGQLNAALAAASLRAAGPSVPQKVDLAGQARGAGLHARRRRAAASKPPQLRPAAVAIRPRRSPPLRPALSPHAAEAVAVGGVNEKRNGLGELPGPFPFPTPLLRPRTACSVLSFLLCSGSASFFSVPAPPISLNSPARRLAARRPRGRIRPTSWVWWFRASAAA